MNEVNIRPSLDIEPCLAGSPNIRCSAVDAKKSRNPCMIFPRSMSHVVDGGAYPIGMRSI